MRISVDQTLTIIDIDRAGLLRFLIPACRVATHGAIALRVGLILIVAPSVSAAEAPEVRTPGLLDGHFALGGGMTYQYDGSKGTTLGLVTWNSPEYRYEFAAFRFLTAQTRLGDALAEPSWVFEVSRRWRLHWNLIDRSGLRLFVGIGAAYKIDTDDLNGSHLNFAEQLGWRFPQQANGGHVEFAIRHMSNAGLKKPNKGEDFLTLAYVF